MSYEHVKSRPTIPIKLPTIPISDMPDPPIRLLAHLLYSLYKKICRLIVFNDDAYEKM